MIYDNFFTQTVNTLINMLVLSVKQIQFSTRSTFVVQKHPPTILKVTSVQTD